MLQTALLVFVFILFTSYFVNRKRSYETYWKHMLAIPGPDNLAVAKKARRGKSKKSPAAVRLFYMMWERSKTYGPIFKLWNFNTPVIFLMDPKDVEIVLSGTKHISKGNSYTYLHNWLGTGLLTSTGSKWQQRRKLLTPAFHFTILRDFVEIFNREADRIVNMLKESSDKPYVNIIAPITDYTLNSIGETSMGVNMSLQSTCQEYKAAIHKFGYYFIYRILRPWLMIPFLFHLTDMSKDIASTVKLLHGFSTAVIEERKQSFEEVTKSTTKKRRALIDVLLKAKNDGLGIDDEGIREEVDTFMFEGHDTITLALSYLLFVLANEPKWQDEIREELSEILIENEKHPSFQQLGEMKLMERCIKESLRLYPSVPLITRVASEEFTTSTGYTVPKAADIQIPIFFMHRSEKIWENPDKFDPDRFLPESSSQRHPFSFIPFSAGPRNCIGQRYAMLEMKAALCGILRNFTMEAVDRPQDIIFNSDMVLRPSGELRIKFVPRESGKILSAQN